jgi:hypothetical protein
MPAFYPFIPTNTTIPYIPTHNNPANIHNGTMPGKHNSTAPCNHNTTTMPHGHTNTTTPYIPINTTVPGTHNFTFHAASAATSLTGNNQPYSAGTSLTTPDIIGIVAGVVVLFGGLAWYVHHALVTVPRRKRVLIREARRGRGRV